MESIDPRGITIYFTGSQKDALIRMSIALNCNPAVIVRLGLKEILAKGEKYIQEGIDAEDLAINEAIKKAKEDRIG